MKIKAIILEDELPARETLKSYLRKYFPNVSVVAEAGRIREARECIESTQFDVIFMDIQLKDGLGIELLTDYANKCKRLVFTTAFEDYTLEAFKHKAFGYLLKPIDPIDFKEIVERVIKDVLISDIQRVKLKVPTAQGFVYVDSSTIVRCESESNYCRIYTKNGKTYLVSKTLKAVEEILSADTGFARIHQSHLVNIWFVDHDRYASNGVTLKTGETIPIARARKEYFRTLLENYRDSNHTMY